MHIFAGNLSFDTTEKDLEGLFGKFGLVVETKIVTRKEKAGRKSRGFGFVNMPNQAEAEAAIAALSGAEFMGRAIDVTPARVKAETEAPRYAARPKAFSAGRRTRSFIKRKILAGEKAEVRPRKNIHENPMRWRKKSFGRKPWQKEPDMKKP